MDELSITFQLSVSGAGEFGLKLNLYTYAVMCYIVVLSYTLLVTSVFFIHFVSHGNFTGIGVVKQQCASSVTNTSQSVEEFFLIFLLSVFIEDSFMIGEDVYLGFCHAPILILF